MVAVGPKTGEGGSQRFDAVNDGGHVINPRIVDGQVHGGAAQVLAQTLAEAVVYDENGSRLIGSLMDDVRRNPGWVGTCP